MSKPPKGPITLEQIEARLQAEEAAKQSKKTSSVVDDSFYKIQTEGHSDSQLAAYKQTNPNARMGTDTPANIQTETDAIIKKQAREAIKQQAVKDIEEAQKVLPKNSLEFKAREMYEGTGKYENLKDLQKKKTDLQLKDASVAQQIKAAAGAQYGPNGATGLFMNQVAGWLPQYFGVDEKVATELKNIDNKIHTIKAPIVAEKRKEREALLAEQQALYAQYNQGAIDEVSDLVPDMDKAKLEAAMLITKRQIKSMDDYTNKAGGWESIGNELPQLATIGTLSMVEKFMLTMPTVAKKNSGEKLTANEELLLKAVASEQEYMSYEQDLERPYSYGLMKDAMHSTVFMAQMGVFGPAQGALKVGGASALSKAASVGLETMVTAAVMPSTYAQIGDNYTGTVDWDKETNTLLVRDDLYKKTLDTNASYRVIAEGVRKDLMSKGELSDEEAVKLDEANARLGYPSESNLMTFDEMDESMKPMSVFRSAQHGYTSSLAEVFAERVIGSKLDSYAKKLGGVRNAINKFDRTRLGGKYNKGMAVLNKATGNIVNSIPSEMAEEYLVSPLHALNDWSTDPLTEWVDNPQSNLDVLAQTAVMGLAFRAVGLGISAKERWRNPEVYKNRKALQKQFQTLSNAVEDKDVTDIVDLANSQSSVDIEYQRAKIAELRTKKENKKADLIESRMFDNMARKAFKTGTITEFEDSLEKMSSNKNLSPETQMTAAKAKMKVSKLKDTYESYKKLPNVGQIVDIEFDMMGVEETLGQINTQKTNLADRVRKDIDGFIKKNYSEDVAYDFDTLFERKDETDPEGKKYNAFVHKLVNKGFTSVDSYNVLDIAEKTSEQYLEDSREELDKQTSSEYQSNLDRKAKFTKAFSQAYNTKKNETWDDLTDRQKRQYWFRGQDILNRRNENEATALFADAFGNRDNKLAKKLFEADKSKGRVKESTVDDIIDNDLDSDVKKGLSSYDIQQVTKKYKEAVQAANEKSLLDEAKQSAKTYPTKTTTEPQQDLPEQEGQMMNNAAQTNAAMNSVVIQQDSLDGPTPAETVQINNFDELPNDTSGFSDEKKTLAGKIVNDFTSQMEKVNGRKPTFEEMLQSLIKYEGKESIDALFGAYRIGWEQNNFAKTDFEKAYNEVFDPLKDAAKKGVNSAQELFDDPVTGEDLTEKAEETEKKIQKKAAKPIGFTVENIPIVVTGRRIGTSVLKFGYSALKYTNKLVNGKWKKESVYDNQLNEDASGLINYKELLNPDKYNAGDRVGVMTAPESVWDRVEISLGIDESGQPKMMLFSDWVADAETKDPNFRQTQSFKDKLPVFTIDAEGNPLSYIHDTDWYNAFNVASPIEGEEEIDPTNISVKHQEMINDGKENVRNLRNKIINDGLSEITISEKKEGAMYIIPEGQPEITVAEANPQSILVVQIDTDLETTKGVTFNNSKRKLVNDPEDFKKLNSKGKYASNGHTWDVRRIGVDPVDGKETYRAFPVTRRNDNGGNGISNANFETIKWMWAAQAKLNTRDEVKSLYTRKVSGTKYDMPTEDAQRIVDDVKRITGVNLLIGVDASQLLASLGAFRKGDALTVYGENLYEKGTTGNNMAQNTSMKKLADKNNVAIITEDGVVNDSGLNYSDYLKTQLTTNIKSFNIGTQENPVYATSLQPIITFEYDEQAKPKTMAEEAQEAVTTPVESMNVNENTSQDELAIEQAESLLNELGISLDDDIDADELPNDIARLDILKMISNVAPELSIIQESQLVDFMFNHLLKIIDGKHDGKVSKKILSEEIKGAYNEVVKPSRDKVAHVLPNLEAVYNKNPEGNTKLKSLINTYKKLIKKYDSIENNWSDIQEKAIEKATKYTEIKEVVAEDTQSEEDLSINEKNFDKSSIEESGKQKSSYRLRRFMAGIHQLNPDGKVKKGFLGLQTYMTFNDVYNSIAQFYGTGVDIISDYNTMVAKLEEMSETHTWVKEFVKKLETSDNQLKNEFVHNYTKHALSMKFAMYSTDKNGTILKMYDTNANEITRKIREDWKNNFKSSKLIDKTKELYSINKPYAKEVLDKYKSWGAEKHNISDEKLRDYLAEFGIEMPNEVWQELKDGKFYYKGKWKTFNDMFYTNNGLFGLLENYLEHIVDPKNTNLDFEENEKNHPHGDMNDVLKVLSKMQSKYESQSMTLTFRDAGKQVSGQVPPKYITDRVSKLKRSILSGDTDFVEQLKRISLSSESTMLELLLTDPEFAEKMDVHHLGITSLKQLGKSTNNYSSITDLNNLDHDVTKIAGFQDIQQGTLKQKVGGFSMRMGSMFLPTMSDKSQMLLMKTGVFNFMRDSVNAFELGGQNGDITVFKPELKELLYNKLVLPELKRIMKFHSQIKETNIKDYDKAAQIFHFIPQLNNVRDENGTRLIKHLAVSDMSMEEIEKQFKTALTNTVERYIHSEAQSKKALWENTVERDSTNAITKVNIFDKKYLNSGIGSLTDKYDTAVYDYVLNSALSTSDMFAVLAGDPALFAKDKHFGKNEPFDQDDSFYERFAKETGVNIGKRMALLIAPGNKLANSIGKTYKQIYLSDVNGMSDNIKYLIDSFYEDMTPALEEQIDYLDSIFDSLDSDDIVEKKMLINQLSAAYPKIADYLDIESTDAQEYTTVYEHLNVLKGLGRVSDEQVKRIDDKIANNEDLVKEELDIVFQPIKPVYTGQITDELQDVSRTVYVKSSSFPLLPQLTRGTKLDNLRLAMEKLEKDSGEYVRASYQSANKVGAMKNAINPFSDSDLASIGQAALTLDRDNFKIQQDVPFKSDKPGTDTVAMGTQIFKLLFGDGVINEGNFNLPSLSDKPLSGQELYDHFNKTFGDLLNIKKQELYDELELDLDGSSKNPKATAEKLQKLLKSEAIKRGYAIQNIKGLELDERKDINGEPYYEFKVPLWLAADSNRYESLLNSIVSNRLLNHKFPGNSFVVGSEAGFAFKEADENGIVPGIEKSRIVYLSNFNGKNLKAASVKGGKLQKPQVFVPSKFKGVDGKLIDLFQKRGGTYVYLRKAANGSLTINEDMIDSELLNLFSFRTPTSSHVSASSVEIAGILPPEVGDLMIVPKNFTKQKGLDFDVDKETAYTLHTTVEKNGKIVPLNVEHKTERLKGLEKALKDAKAEEEIVAILGNLGGQMGTDVIDYLKDDANSIISKYNKIEKEFDKKLAENEFIRVHNAVYSNTSNSVQNRINQVLSMDFAKGQAELIEKASQNTDSAESFSILSDQYQKEKMSLGAAGKLAIGVYSNYVTFHGLAQQTTEQMNMILPEEISSVIIGDYESDGSFGKRMTLDESRSIAEAFAERQNTATDNEKEQVLGRVNVNSTTINVDSLLAALGFDKDKNGNSISYLLLSQPIIRRYVQMLNDARGITSEYVADLENKVITQLVNEYSQGKFVYDADNRQLLDKVTYEPIDFSKKLNGDNMLNGISKNNKSQEAGEIQAAALAKFLQLDKYAKSMTKIQSVVNTKNLGKSIIESNDGYNQLEKFSDNKLFDGITQLIGDFTDERPETDGDKYIRVGDKYIRPMTPQGHIVVNGLASGHDLWRKYFPYSDESFSEVIQEILKVTETDTDSPYKRIETGQQIVQEVKKYIYSRKNNGLFNDSALNERARLFMDTDTNDSLAMYLTNLKDNPEFSAGVRTVKENRLMNKFTYAPETNGQPSIIKFNNTSNDNFDDEYLYNSFPELILEDKPLPPKNGQPYSTKQLAQDLITYAYVEGGVQEAIQFIKHIPVEYLESVSINTEEGPMSVNQVFQTYNTVKRPDIFKQLLGIRNLTKKNPHETHVFVKQYIQHHPDKAKQYSKEERKSFDKQVMKDGTLDSFILVSEDKPKFISVKNPTKSKLKQEKFTLYENAGNNEFKRISVLGAHGMNEYTFGKQNATSLLSKTKIEPISKKPDVKTQIPKTVSTPFGMTNGASMKTVLQNIADADLKDAPRLKVLAGYLLPFAKESTSLTIGTGMGYKGRYRYTEDGIDLDTKDMTSPEVAAQIFLHEFVHSVTSNELRQYYDEKGTTLLPNAPAHVVSLHMVYNEFRKQYTSEEIDRFIDKRERQSSNNLGIDDYSDGKLYSEREMNDLYPASSVFEFVAKMIDNKDLQDRMSQVKYKATNESIWARFKQAILKTIKAIHPTSKGDSITDNAISEILNFVETEQQSVKAKDLREKSQAEKDWAEMQPNLPPVDEGPNSSEWGEPKNNNGRAEEDLLPNNDVLLLPDCI